MAEVATPSTESTRFDSPSGSPVAPSSSTSSLDLASEISDDPPTKRSAFRFTFTLFTVVYLAILWTYKIIEAVTSYYQWNRASTTLNFLFDTVVTPSLHHFAARREQPGKLRYIFDTEFKDAFRDFVRVVYGARRPSAGCTRDEEASLELSGLDGGTSPDSDLSMSSTLADDSDASLNIPSSLVKAEPLLVAIPGSDVLSRPEDDSGVATIRTTGIQPFNIALPANGLRARTGLVSVKGETQCPLCPKSFRLYSAWQDHCTSRLDHHYCALCSVPFGSAEELRRHKLTDPAHNSGSFSGEDTLKCLLCQAAFDSEQARNSHVQNAPHKCKTCDREFGNFQDACIHSAGSDGSVGHSFSQ
uniref:C2H2-type domain-containing protein n=1 Tax=Mycena chlorophos TaxID=658473 RepID=A0ABQ0LY47_MYCCL|nr:predicted protein [Mycena chlorophos]